MSNYFINNKDRIATLFLDKNYGYIWLLIMSGLLSLYSLLSWYGVVCISIFIILIIVNIRLVKLERKIYEFEYLREYSLLLNNNHKRLESYISNNIKDDSLIADPLFFFEAESLEISTLEKLKDKDFGVITKSKIISYLATNSNSWSLHLRKDDLFLISPFKINILLFCEHSLIILSQTCILPKCQEMSIVVKEIKYYKMDYEVKPNLIKIEDVLLKPFNSKHTQKIAVILEAIKPYIES